MNFKFLIFSWDQSFKTNNKKYACGYVPPLDRPVEDMHCYDLEDVFKKEKVDMFSKTLRSTFNKLM